MAMPRAGVGGVVRRAGQRVWHREPVAAWDLLNGRRAPLPSGAVETACRHAYMVRPARLAIYGDGCCWSGCLPCVEVAPSPLFFLSFVSSYRTRRARVSSPWPLPLLQQHTGAVFVAVCDSSLTQDEGTPVGWSGRLCGATPREDFRCKARSKPVPFLVVLLLVCPPDVKSLIICLHAPNEVPAEKRTRPERRRTHAAARSASCFTSPIPDVVRGGAFPSATTRTVGGDPYFLTLVGGAVVAGGGGHTPWERARVSAAGVCRKDTEDFPSLACCRIAEKV